MILFAAQMAFWTSGGASSGAAARPSGCSLATEPGTTGCSDGSCVPYSRPPDAVTDVVELDAVPPEDDVSARAGEAKANSPSSTMTMLGSERTRTETTSFVGLRG